MNDSNAPLLNQECLEEVVNEICDRLQMGEAVDIDRLAEAYPELSEQLRSLYPTLLAVSSLNPQGHSGELSPSVGSNGDNELLGDFRIIRQIGRGGMGIVYEAQQRSINRRVALKILPLAALVDQRALHRFRNEVTAIATLQHPHIVSVYAVGEERGIHYFAMQLIHGQSLAAVINELRERASREESVIGDAISQIVSDMEDATTEISVSPNRRPGNVELEETVARGRSATNGARIIDPGYFRNVVGLVQQAANALQHAHDHGIVHRDVKPANLLLDTHGNLFVTDFGLARIEAGAGVTMTGDVLGTLRYMSPEQILANRVVIDHRTDVYSLGVTLYELLTLQPMWSGEDKPDLIRQISFDEPIRPQRLNPAIPIDLETIVLKAISKNPSDRYNSAQSFADDLQRYRDNKSIIARRPTAIKRIAKWTQRNPAIMWSAIIMLAMATVALGVSNYLISRERMAKNLALTDSQQSEKSARESQRQAQAIADFVVFDFLALTSVEGQGRFEPGASSALNKDTSLRVLLDRAAEKIRQRRDLDPRTEADLAWIIGISFRGVGDFDQAVEFLEQCLALREEILGADDWKTLSALNSLAVACQSRRETGPGLAST